METKIIRQKLITDFSNFIQDDAKLEVLEGVFDAIKNEENTSIVSMRTPGSICSYNSLRKLSFIRECIYMRYLKSCIS